MYQVRIGSYVHLGSMATIYVTGSDDYCATELTFTTKANDIGTLSMTIPPQNINYELIQKNADPADWYGLGCYIEVLQDQDEANPLWNGIITGFEKDMFGQLHIIAYDMLYVTKFQVLPTRLWQNQKYIDLYSWLVSHNNYDEGSQTYFNPNYIIAIDTTYSVQEYFPELNTENMTTFDAIQKLSEDRSVFYPVYRSYEAITLGQPCVVIYVRTEGSAEFNTQSIELGGNLLDYMSTNTTDDWLTSIAPISEDANGNIITITSVTSDGSGYLKMPSDVIARYGERRQRIKFENVTDPAELMGYGNHYLIINALPELSIDASAFDKHMINGSIEEFKVGRKTDIHLYSLGVSLKAMTNEKTVDCMNPENTKISFSNVIIPTMTQKLSAIQKEQRR